MATPTPVATYGRDAKVAEAIRQKLLPDIDGKSAPKVVKNTQTVIQ